MIRLGRWQSAIVVVAALAVATGCGSTNDKKKAANTATPTSAASSQPAAGPLTNETQGLPDASAGPATGSPVSVGVFTAAPEQDQQVKQQGVKGDVIGNEPAQYKAIANYLNAHGGLNGHPIDLVVKTFVNPSGNPTETDFQAACTDFTQDHHVVAVATDSSGATLVSCLQAAGVPLLINGYVAGDASDYTANPVILSPYSMNLDRLAKVEVDSLYNQGFFTTGSKVGIVADSLPIYREALKNSMIPTLESHGVKVVATATYDRSGLAPAQRDVGAAVLKFHASGVNKVMFLQGGGLGTALFMTVAESQHWRPDYGLTSNDGPEPVSENVPKVQFIKMMGVGYYPQGGDVGPSSYPPLPPAGKLCLDILHKAGQAAPDTNSRGIALGNCDASFLMAAAASHAGSDLSAATLLQGVDQVGVMASASTFAARFDAQHHDGAALVRPFKWSQSCNCLVYSGPTEPAE